MTERKYFGTDGIRGPANKYPMTADFALKLGVAAGHYFGVSNQKFRVVIGKDTRRSCYMFEAALTAGLISVGADVMLLGPVPTPGIGILTKSMRADFGIMISASHNPHSDNGIKLFDANGYKLPDTAENEIEALIDSCLSDHLVEAEHLGRTRRYEDAQARYIEIVKSSFPKDLTLQGMRIVIDCANGAAYRVAPQILFELGAEVIPINVSPDGFNINQNCGATHTETLSKAVNEYRADIGIALDGDADRLMLSDENGKILDGDVIIGIIATKLHSDNSLTNNKVAITVMSNMALENYLASLGLTVVRTKVGDRYVVEAMRQQNIKLGGEQSGHVIVSDYATTGDGLIAALHVLANICRSNKKLSQISQLFKPFPQLLTNIRYKDNLPLDNEIVKDAIAKAEKKLGKKGRVLIRKSGTEPLIRIMVEAEDRHLMQNVSDHLTKIIQENI
ncbi:MAG: phosphoglucosamine mutase [Alphaproteobacteria bacterium]|jgi:phosphoglucosamine mutase